MAELHLYDFDGTLFRSPDRPDGWAASKSWAYDPQSLDYPCIPRKPGTEWWNSSVVNSARQSIADSDVYTVMATGRADSRFRWVVPELLKNKGLDFDEVHLNPGGDTGAFKRKLLQRTLARYSFIDTVRIWDDQAELIASYVKMIEGMGLTVDSTHIRTVRPDALCDANAQPKRVARRWIRRTASQAPYLYDDAGKDAPAKVRAAIVEYRKLPEEFRKDNPLLFWLLGDGTPLFKMTKVEAAYADPSPFKKQNCGNCLHSYSHVTSGTFICDQMRGAIKPEAWCRVWKPAIAKAEYRKYQERTAAATKTLPKGTVVYHGSPDTRKFSHPDGPAWFGFSRSDSEFYAGWRGIPSDKFHSPGTHKYRLIKSLTVPTTSNKTQLVLDLMVQAGLITRGQQDAVYNTYPLSMSTDSWNNQDKETSPELAKLQEVFQRHAITNYPAVLRYLCSVLPSFHGYVGEREDELVLCDPKKWLLRLTRQPLRKPRVKPSERKRQERERARLARFETPESEQYHADSAARDKHVKQALRAFKILVPKLNPHAETAKTEFPGRDKLSLKRRGGAFIKAVKALPEVLAFLDEFIGTESDDPKAKGWRNQIVYQARNVLLTTKYSMKKAGEEVAKQAFKGFKAMVMAEAQAPLREIIPPSLREFLPENIIVEVDEHGTISKITDRFENEHETLGKKVDSMRSLVAQYNEIALQVKADLKSGDELTKLAALITAIIMETGIRPGKAGNAVVKTINDEKLEIETFGAITLGPQHVNFIRRNFAKLEFIGKKGGTNIANVADANIVKMLQSYVDRALKKGTPYIFTTARGEQFTYSNLQTYFRNSILREFKPTDFRKLRATAAVLEALAEEQQSLYARIRGFAKVQKADLKERLSEEIAETFRAAVTRAQSALSHESVKTTLRSYINPEIIFRFLSQASIEAKLEDVILQGKPTLAFRPAQFIGLAKMKKKGKEFPSEGALKEYLKEHPEADKSKHTVTEGEEKSKEPEKKERATGAGALKEELNVKMNAVSKESIQTWASSFGSFAGKKLARLGKAILESPAQVQHFVTDKKHRKEVLSSISNGIKESADALREAALKEVKTQGKSYKRAAKAVKKLITPPSTKLNATEMRSLAWSTTRLAASIGTAVALGPAAGALFWGKAHGALFLRQMAAKAAFRATEGTIDADKFYHHLDDYKLLSNALSAVSLITAADKEKAIDDAIDQALGDYAMNLLVDEFEKGFTDEEMAEMMLEGGTPMDTGTDKTAAGTAKDITNNLPAFQKAYDDVVRAVKHGHIRDLAGDHMVVRRWANQPWVALITRGLPIVEGLLSTRSIPPRKAKGLEMAYRLFFRSRQMPKDVYKWWAKNQKRCLLVLDAAKNWPEKQEGGDELFKLGSFTVYNTIGVSGVELEGFKKALAAAEQMIKKNPIPGISRTLYGDVYYVGQIGNAHHAAWYNYKEDILYIRPNKKQWGHDGAQTIVHELGHRFWRKFADKRKRNEWDGHHLGVQIKQVDVKMPDVGDSLPVRFRGAPRGWRPVVDHTTQGQYWFKTPDGRMDSITRFRVHQIANKNEGDEKRFPTRYSAKNEEEHFCESLKLLAAGMLPDEHAIPFNAIWNSGGKSASLQDILDDLEEDMDLAGVSPPSKTARTISDRWLRRIIARSYKDYVQEKEQKGEAPLSNKEWSSRHKDKKPLSAKMKKAIESLKSKSQEFKKKLQQELTESKEMVGTLGRMLKGDKVPDEDKKAAAAQVFDILKLSIVAVPGASLIILLSKAVNKAFGTDFSLLPSSFRTAKAETSEQVADRVVDAVLAELENVAQ